MAKGEAELVQKKSFNWKFVAIGLVFVVALYGAYMVISPGISSATADKVVSDQDLTGAKSDVSTATGKVSSSLNNIQRSLIV